MAKEMLINVSEGEECRIALLDDGKLEELYMERTSSTSHVGNIYKGRVTNVEPSIQAAFVDFGLGRNGFLHISDLMPTYFGRQGEDVTESVGRKIARRDRPPIQRCLRRGDEIIVQIIKEGIGTKGPTLTTYLSIPGRILVMMPGMSKFGVSRKIEDEDERRRLRQILDSLKPIDDVGFIIRTAGVGKTKAEIQRDLAYLTRLWQNIQKKLEQPAPIELYTEGDLVTRTVRDVFTSDVDRIVVDNKDVARRIKEFFKIAMPRTKNKVDLFEKPVPLFHEYGIEREIEQMYSRHVPLPSGGSLVIDSTEAIVAIDVNSGKFRDHSDAEVTAFKTDMEAADEIARQLKLRDLGGVIICDFIDLRYERHRRDLDKKLHDLLKKDRAKTKVLRMSQFGIIEMTRQRMRPSLKRSVYFDCPHCKGSGLVKTPESMGLDVMRRLAIALNDLKVARAELAVCPEVAFYLLNKKRAQLAELERAAKKKILIRQDLTVGLDEIRLQLFDARDGLVYLEELGMSPHDAAQPDARRRHQHPPRRDERRPSALQPPRRNQRRQPTRPTADEEDELEAIERVAEAVEQADEGDVLEADEVLIAPRAESDEAEGEAVEAVGGEAGEDAGEQPGGRRRRRRGRRGGRGRGGGTQQAQPQRQEPPHADLEDLAEPQQAPHEAEDDASEEDEAADAPLPDEQPAGENGEGPRRRRRRRGGRRHRRRKEAAAAATNGEPQSAADAAMPSDQRAEAEPVEVVRTGSSDRHLMQSEVHEHDEPEAPRRLSHYRDLDFIPDDAE
jgi:ribonuclease E